MNAGSYVISPKSSGPVLICLRSMARIAPSLTGSSYVFPVRLSVTVSVSAIEVGDSRSFLFVETLLVAILILIFVGRGYPFAGDAVASIGPSRQVFVAASLAAERTPRRVYRALAAQDAQPGVAHPANS